MGKKALKENLLGSKRGSEENSRGQGITIK